MPRKRNLPAVPYIQFVMLMMERHQGSGGWVQISEIQERCGVSRATAYRYIGYAISAGLPLVMDSDDPTFTRDKKPLGVRCNLVSAPRLPDPHAALRRKNFGHRADSCQDEMPIAPPISVTMPA
jgi:hypothetical protein